MQKETKGEKHPQPLIVSMPLLLLISYIPCSTRIKVKVNGSLQNNMLDVNVLAVITNYKHIHLHIMWSLLIINMIVHRAHLNWGLSTTCIPLAAAHLNEQEKLYISTQSAFSFTINWWGTFVQWLYHTAILHTHTHIHLYTRKNKLKQSIWLLLSSYAYPVEQHWSTSVLLRY